MPIATAIGEFSFTSRGMDVLPVGGKSLVHSLLAVLSLCRIWQLFVQ
jgi:hypothetical protein